MYTACVSRFRALIHFQRIYNFTYILVQIEHVNNRSS